MSAILKMRRDERPISAAHRLLKAVMHRQVKAARLPPPDILERTITQPVVWLPQPEHQAFRV
jgi:hypothetical protein